MIDLHIHSNFSDGRLSPEQIVQLAATQGISTISITDHDSVMGIENALHAGNKYNINIIPGIEISVDFVREMHILGYYINPSNEELIEYSLRSKEKAKVEFIKALSKLRQQGICVDIHEIRKRGETISINSILQQMLERNYITAKTEGYQKYFARNKVAYIHGLKLKPSEAINLIRKSGGIAVLAHPNRICNDFDMLRKIICSLKTYGLSGIEIYYPTISYRMQRFLIDIANSMSFGVTAGSDFHGYDDQIIAKCSKYLVPANIIDWMKSNEN